MLRVTVSRIRDAIRVCALCSVGFLAGCAALRPATLTFVDRSSGNEYLGRTASGTVGRSAGELSAAIEGSTYTGHWIYTPSGGGYSLASMVAFSGHTRQSPQVPAWTSQLMATAW